MGFKLKYNIFKIVFTAIVLFIFPCCECQNLVAVEVNTKLPDSSAYHASVYSDSVNKIYILGGYTGSSYQNVIYEYDFGRDSIETLNSFPKGIHSGVAVFEGQGSIFYFGGWDGSYCRNIYKFNIENRELSVVGQLEADILYGVGITQFSADTNKVLIFSGYWDILHCLDLTTFSSCGTIQLALAYYIIGVFVHDEYAYVFGSYDKNRMEKINLETLQVEVISTLLPILDWGPSVVYDGTFGYIIGGSYEEDPDFPTNGIIRYDPRNNQAEFLPVDNFPEGYWRSGTCHYVKDLDRIYCIGGVDSNGYRDEIFYIDLHPNAEPTSPGTTYLTSTENEISTTTEVQGSTTLNPDIFTCLGKPDGMYPHPFDCAKFIGCHNEVEEFYECPPPLLFSPVLLTCTFPEDVDCDISCNGKPDGMYEHPHSCSLFIGCHDGVVEVYKCPEPLLFNPITKQCDFQEDVECNIE